MPNAALIVGGEIVPMDSTWVDLAREGQISADTPMVGHLVGHCTIADWRAGRFFRHLGDEPELVSILFARGDS